MFHCQIKVVNVFLIAVTTPSVSANIRSVCSEGDKCGFGKFVVRKLGTDPQSNGTQTCTDQCTLFPRWRFRSGYECGECTISNVVDGFNSELVVTSCTESTVVVQGSGSGSLQVGENFIYSGTNNLICSNCSPLFRKIISIADGPTADSKILTTSFATFIDVFDDDVIDLSISANVEIEPIFNCTYESIENRLLMSHHDKHRVLQSYPRACPDWKSLNVDGRCLYTDCFVGTDGDPNDCFVCKDKCDNTCGSEDGIKVSGDFLLYDFGEACCIHDHCYNSVFDQETCDDEFLKDMLSTCPILPLPLIRITGPIGFVVLQGLCPLTALLFYGLVRKFGAEAYANAQGDQTEYEKLPVCVAQCPTTQTSGGQGVTRLVIDLLEISGTFPVSYEMYTIPDELSIVYEGKTIYSTGGLVSGGSSVAVSYSGSTTIIEVTINAPLDNTAWDVFVGCPREP
jgi:hypothetical protein